MGSPVLSIKLRCASWQQLSVIYRRDLCRQTIFLRTQNPPPVGTAVRIDLTLPSETTVSMTGEIAGHVPSSDSRGGGIDVKLAPLAPNSMWLIESALASEAKLRQDSKNEVQPALSDRQELAHAEGELVSALASEIESLHRLNPFQVLGLGYEAGDTEVRAAFAELTKRYHPDRFARYQSAEPRRLAAEIFILIRDAYRKLGDPQTRAATLAIIGRVGDPRAIPVVRTGTVPVVRSGASQVVARASIPARPEPSPLPPVQTQQGPSRAQSGSAAAITATGKATDKATGKPIGKAISDIELAHLEQLLDAGAYDEALAAFKSLAKRAPNDRHVRAGMELCEGFLAFAARDRLEAAQKFEAVLEIDPSNERAARQLAEMRRQATNERKGLLSRLMGKKE
jgi:tetratricopeptide (TPR) repeat protein